MELFERLTRIETRLDEYNKQLEIHIAGTNEMREFMKGETENQQEILKIIVKQSENARKDQMRTIKITLGVFAALAALVTALAAWLSHN